MSTAALDLDPSFEGRPSRTRRIWRALRGNLGVVLALVFLAALAAAALAEEPLGPLIWFRPGRTSRLFWLTPYLISDPATVRFWTAMLHAAGPTLAVAFAAVAGALAIGAPLGVLAGMRGLSWIGRPLKAALDIVEAFPPLVLAILGVVAIAAIEITLAGWTAAREAKLALVLAVLFAPHLARAAHDEMRRAQREPHLAAERALGASALHIAIHSVLRRCGRPLAAGAASLVGAAILMETTLSFLGIGMPANLPSWGVHIATGLRPMFAGNWLAVVVPTTLLLLTVGTVSFLARTLRSRLGVRGAP